MFLGLVLWLLPFVRCFQFWCCRGLVRLALWVVLLLMEFLRVSLKDVGEVCVWLGGNDCSNNTQIERSSHNAKNTNNTKTHNNPKTNKTTTFK